MPTAAYILMALEAARQLQELHGLATSTLGFSDFVFEEPFPLALFRDADTMIEFQLISRQTEKDRIFEFEILSAGAECQTEWTRHCAGNIHLGSNSTNPVHASSFSPCHDPILLEKSQLFGHDTSSHLKGLQLGSQGSTGHFDAYISSHEHYPLNPMVLDSILRLSPVSLLARNLPAVYKLRSIGCMKFPVRVETTDTGTFTIAIDSAHSYACHSSVEINQTNILYSLENLYYEADRLLAPEPLMKSLFFKPINLPDITKQPDSDIMSISDCLRRLTHKWPMTDVKIAGLEHGDLKIILETLQDTSADRRRRFRSVQILGTQGDVDSDLFQYVDSFDVETKAHIIFSHHLNPAQVSSQLQPNGFACTRGSDEKEYSSSFNMVCKVIGLYHDDWVLWRRSEEPDLEFAGCKTVLFGCLSQSTSIENLKATEHIPLQQQAIREFCERSKEEKFNALVLDDFEKSIITTWQGRYLVPWLQILLKFAESILWVTSGGQYNPFVNVAGTLLRTLQSEQPSLKVTWLVFRDAEPVDVLQRHILSAYNSLLRGENEVRLEVKDSKTNILRYVPDDDISARLGLSLPTLVHKPIGNRNYHLSLAAPLEPVILILN